MTETVANKIELRDLLDQWIGNNDTVLGFLDPDFDPVRYEEDEEYGCEIDRALDRADVDLELFLAWLGETPASWERP